MKKIPSVFKRHYDGDRLVYDEVVEGCEWVLAGEGVATEKFDGICCMFRGGRLYTRYDRKLTKGGMKRLRQGGYAPSLEDFKPAPDGWEAAEDEPDIHTGHWPGWVPIDSGPEYRYHWDAVTQLHFSLKEGTYELVGPKSQGNPYQLSYHDLWRHGTKLLEDCPRTFEAIRDYLAERNWLEGIVWHHPDGRMAKIKRRDFGLPWPVLKED